MPVAQASFSVASCCGASLILYAQCLCTESLCAIYLSLKSNHLSIHPSIYKSIVVVVECLGAQSSFFFCCCVAAIDLCCVERVWIDRAMRCYGPEGGGSFSDKQAAPN